MGHDGRPRLLLQWACPPTERPHFAAATLPKANPLHAEHPVPTPVAVRHDRDGNRVPAPASEPRRDGARPDRRPGTDEHGAAGRQRRRSRSCRRSPRKKKKLLAAQRKLMVGLHAAQYARKLLGVRVPVRRQLAPHRLRLLRLRPLRLRALRHLARRTRATPTSSAAAASAAGALKPGDLVFFDGERPRRHLRRPRPLHPRTAHRHRRLDLDDERLVQLSASTAPGASRSDAARSAGARLEPVATTVAAAGLTQQRGRAQARRAAARRRRSRAARTRASSSRTSSRSST